LYFTVWILDLSSGGSGYIVITWTRKPR